MYETLSKTLVMNTPSKHRDMIGLLAGIILIALGATVFGNSLIGSGLSLGGVIILIGSIIRIKKSQQSSK